MLSDRVKRLLAGAVDGDLNRRQRRRFEQAVEQSPEALELYRGMQEDARRLRLMPRVSLPADFSDRVMAAIDPTVAVQPAVLARGTQQSLPAWANFAAAAAIVLAVSVGTYLVVAVNNRQKSAQELAQRIVAPQTPPSINHPENTVVLPDVAVRESTRPPVDISESLPMPREEIVASIPMQEPAEAPEQSSPGVLTIPFSPSLNLFKVEMPKLPSILPVRELDQARQRALMLESIKAEDACHIDLFCKDANKGFERVQAALRAQGKRTIVEALAQQRLQSRAKTSFVFFTEALTADEVTKLFAALAVEERKSDAKQADKVVVTGLTPGNQKTMAGLLGVDPKLWNIKNKPAGPIDPQKPISDSTGDKIAKAIAEREKGNAAAKTVDHVVIGLSYNPVRPTPVLSKEIREYLNSHKDHRPGTIPLMLIVRNFD